MQQPFFILNQIIKNAPISRLSAHKNADFFLDLGVFFCFSALSLSSSNLAHFSAFHFGEGGPLAVDEDKTLIYAARFISLVIPSRPARSTYEGSRRYAPHSSHNLTFETPNNRLIAAFLLLFSRAEKV